MPILQYYSTSGKWCQFTLATRTTIGRSPDQDLQLLDRLVSKSHAEITLGKDGLYSIRDMGSRNGTLVNGKMLTAIPAKLKDGDEIALGSHILRFIDDGADAPDQKSLLPGNAVSGLLRGSDIRTPIFDNSVPGRPSQPIRQRISEAEFLPEAEIASEDDLRRDYEKLRIANELSSVATGVFDLDELLSIILDKAFQVFNADRGAILLKDDFSGKMTVRLALNSDKSTIPNYKISETLLDEVIVEKSAVLSNDALQDSRFAGSDSIIFDNVRSTMCVPLLCDGNVQGVINLDTQIITGAFQEKDLQILTGFAQQAAQNIQRNKLVENMRKQAVVQDNLRRIISPHLIDDVLSGKIKLEKSSSRKNATVLFADIRGFTQMAEQNAPEDIVNLINDFCERMVECIFKHEGALDKFVGDEVMAVWGAGMTCRDHATRAVRCAIDMIKSIAELNTVREKVQLPPISIGIGVASGLMIAGYMGSTQAMSYTVIGDTVNLASRICSAAQPGEILVNKETWENVRNSVSCLVLPPMFVKGKQKPIEIFRVEAYDRPPYEEAYDAYRSAVHSSVRDDWMT